MKKNYTIVGLNCGTPCTDHIEAGSVKAAMKKFFKERGGFNVEIVDVFEGTLQSVMPSEFFETAKESDLKR
jgi:hypothetical protein